MLIHAQPQKNSRFLDDIYVYLAVFSAFFFSYIPLTYVLDAIHVSKPLAYMVFTSITLLIMAYNVYSGNLKIQPGSLTIVGLSLFFAVYAIGSFIFTDNYFHDYQTVTVLGILNPLYILFAVLIADKKPQVARFLFILAAIYFLVVFYKWISGDLRPEKGTAFIQVFDTVGAEFYQNINKYLGLLCILSIGLFTQRHWLLTLAKTALVVLCLFFMLQIGGRAAIVALLMVLAFWFLVENARLDSIYFIASLIIIVAISYGLLVSLDKLIIFMQESSITSLNRFASLLLGSDSSHRGFLFSNAIAQFTDSPKNLFFGGGMNTFSVFTKEYNLGLYPHNIILELLAEYGIIGFIAFILPILYLFRERIKVLGSYIGNDHFERLFFMLFLYYFIIHMFTIGLRNSWFFIFMIFLLFPYHRKQQIAYRISET